VLGAAPAMGVVHVLLGFHPMGPLRLPSGPDSGVRDIIIIISDATIFIIIIMTSCTTAKVTCTSCTEVETIRDVYESPHQRFYK
jgi:hypothetical protein